MLLFFKLIARVIGSPQLERSRTSIGPYKDGAEREAGAFLIVDGLISKGRIPGRISTCPDLPVYDLKHSYLALRPTCAQTF